MSAGTLRELQQADYLNYGFVSLHASDAIQALMEGKPSLRAIASRCRMRANSLRPSPTGWIS